MKKNITAKEYDAFFRRWGARVWYSLLAVVVMFVISTAATMVVMAITVDGWFKVSTSGAYQHELWWMYQAWTTGILAGIALLYWLCRPPEEKNPELWVIPVPPDASSINRRDKMKHKHSTTRNY